MTEGFQKAGDEMMKIMQPTIDATPVAQRMADPSEIAFAVGFLCERTSEMDQWRALVCQRRSLRRLTLNKTD